MAIAFVKEARRIRQEGRLTDKLIARATTAKPSTVRAWFAGRSSPTGARAERLAELAEIVDRLGRVVDRDYIPVWLLKPVRALGDEKPIEVLARGEFTRVSRLISSLEEPGAA